MDNKKRISEEEISKLYDHALCIQDHLEDDGDGCINKANEIIIFFRDYFKNLDEATS